MSDYSCCLPLEGWRRRMFDDSLRQTASMYTTHHKKTTEKMSKHSTSFDEEKPDQKECAEEVTLEQLYL